MWLYNINVPTNRTCNCIYLTFILVLIPYSRLGFMIYIDLRLETSYRETNKKNQSKIELSMFPRFSINPMFTCYRDIKSNGTWWYFNIVVSDVYLIWHVHVWVNIDAMIAKANIAIHNWHVCRSHLISRSWESSSLKHSSWHMKQNSYCNMLVNLWTVHSVVVICWFVLNLMVLS